jgi:hypothetical protein
MDGVNDGYQNAANHNQKHSVYANDCPLASQS